MFGSVCRRKVASEGVLVGLEWHAEGSDVV